MPPDPLDPKVLAAIGLVVAVGEVACTPCLNKGWDETDLEDSVGPCLFFSDPPTDTYVGPCLTPVPTDEPWPDSPDDSCLTLVPTGYEEPDTDTGDDSDSDTGDDSDTDGDSDTDSPVDSDTDPPVDSDSDPPVDSDTDTDAAQHLDAPPGATPPLGSEALRRQLLEDLFREGILTRDLFELD